MKKTIFCSFIILFFSVLSSKTMAQLPKALVFGNLTYANPSGSSFISNYKNGIGFEVGAGVGLGKTVFIGSLGYMNYNAFNNSANNLKLMPVKLGVRRYLVGKLFVNGNIGLAIQSYDNISSSSASSFLYEIGAGVKVLKIFELGVAYTGWKLNNYDTQAGAILFKLGTSIKI
jgi:hypothetical protein